MARAKPKPKPIRMNVGAVKLRELLDADTPTSRKIKASFDRAMLWRYTIGRDRPGLKTSLELRRLSRGRLKETDWIEPVADSR